MILTDSDFSNNLNPVLRNLNLLIPNINEIVVNKAFDIYKMCGHFKKANKPNAFD